MAIRKDTYQKIAKASRQPINQLHWLTNHERIAVRSASETICSFEHKIRSSNGVMDKVGEVALNAFRSGLMTGLSIAADRWWKDIPAIVDRYMAQVSCEEILRARDERQ